ncbi:hypothetical protein SLE2022_195370 [Rubroshorea leprosula]
MDHHLEPKRNSRDQQCGTTEKTMLPQASNRGNSRGRFKQEKPNLSYADLHREITKSTSDVSPKSSCNYQKHHAGMKANEDDELVKYMSSLPSYLERGKNPQEKVLTVGVLEWGRLEKWQYSHKQVSHRSSISSLSNSNTSSSFSTDESSAHSSRGHSCSPTHQWARRLPLQFHLMSSPKEDNLHGGKPLGDGVGKPQDLKAADGNTFNVQAKCIGADKSSIRNHPAIKPEQFRGKDTRSRIKSEYGTSDGVNSKVNIVRQDGKSMNKEEKFQKENLDDLKQDFSGKGKTVVLLQPRDFPKMNDSGASGLSDPTTNTSQQKAAPSQRSVAEKLNEANHDKSNSNLSHSCPLPREVDGRNLPRIKPVDAKNIEFSSEMSCSALHSAKTGCSPARSRNLEGRVASVKPVVNEPLKVSDLRVSKVAPEKVRSTSPFRRFTFGIGKTSKSSSSRDTSAVPQLSPVYTSVKCDSEIPVASHHASTYGDRTNAASKGRSSPLRRLLDPLLKPKAVSCSNVAESVEKRSISTERARKSSHGLALSSTTSLSSGKVKSETTSTRCSTVNVNDSSEYNKHGSSVIQALLRVQFKNGLPLFTFAVNNGSDILAATMNMFSAPSKDNHGCIFTFFSIQEVKKKNGRWINQGGKGKGRDYIPNVVAQMKVSGSDISHLPRQNCIDQFRVREFVLLGVDLGQANQPTSDFQQKDELAAIVMKIPKRITKGSSRDGYQTDMHNDSHQAGLKDCLPEVKFDSSFVKNTRNSLFLGHQDIDTTVILPSGVHSLPSKGGPSSLIQRWTAGGSCDCGGWDLGCKLKVLSNGNQLSQRPGLTKSSEDADPFELFFEGGPQENRPFFSMAPFKDGIYSVEFNSSLSHMQAFSICIAVWDSRRFCELSGSINSFEERTSLETILVQNEGTKAPNPTEGETPGRYVSYPPISPVGRV